MKATRPRLEDLPTFRKFLQPGDFVIDVGGHVGDTTLSYGLAFAMGVALTELEYSSTPLIL